ncbi:HEAT repeat protein [Labilithrix luteola]|uniref:HEAT repeat protein n=1 Tax=Labilithrix luteola TaxID=1391654 RepID=A0A0K1PL08_9BACT|nr:HEAT repeat domain-containing protein [Labilithrix luteola]AKU94208.1 HEAT repeat protein [Labilithrix luteola]
MSERSHPARDVRTRLGDAEPEVRRLATQQLPRLPAPESCELLLVALGDDDWRVRKEAASVASRIEPRTAVVFAVARALGERDNIGQRNAAVEALVLIGPDAVPGAIDALGRLDADGRKLAAEVLAGAPTLAGMRALAHALRDEDPNVIVAAVEALGQAHLAGDEARDVARTSLTRMLASTQTPVRLAALEALRGLDVEIPWPELEPLLADPILRRPALSAAGGSRVPRAIRALAEAIADGSASVSREATIALGRSIEAAWGEDQLLDVAAKTLRASFYARARLRAFAKDASDPQGRASAVLALGLVRDPDDVSLIADALADDEVADRAEAALRLFGQDAMEPLLVAGRTAAPSLRGAAISMIPQLAPEAATSEPLLAVREALSDEASEVVVPALKSLAIVGGPIDLEPIARHVSSADPQVAGAASAALLAIAIRHPERARRMVSGVDPRGDGALVATILLEALASAQKAAPSDSAFLASALTHREAAARRSAIEALATMGGEDAATAVTVSLADEESAVVHAAIRALGRLGRAEQLASLAATTRDPLRLGGILRALKEADPERAFAAARPLLRSREAAVAVAAVEVVGAIEIEARADALMDATDHPDHEVIKIALAQLANTKDERAIVALARALEHPAEAVRRYTAEILGQQDAPEAETILRARLDRERSVEVRRVIMEALSALSARSDLEAGA